MPHQREVQVDVWPLPQVWYPNSLGPEVISSQLGLVYLHRQLVVLRFEAQDLGKESTLSDLLVPRAIYGLSQRKHHWLGSIYNIPLDNTNSQTCELCWCDTGGAHARGCMAKGEGIEPKGARDGR